jgi:hypothetical protein
MSKTLEVFVVEHDVKGTPDTIRMSPVARRWTEGPERDCMVGTARLSLKTAKAIAEWYEEHRDG